MPRAERVLGQQARRATMKAAFQVQHSKEHPMALRADMNAVQKPTLEGLPKGMLLMKAVATSICGSDLWGASTCPQHAWRGVIDHFYSKQGAVGGSGHEVIAEVIEVVEPSLRRPGELVLCMTTSYIQSSKAVKESFEMKTQFSAENLPKQGSFCEYFISYDDLTVTVPDHAPPGYPAFNRLWYVAAQPVGTVIHAFKKVPSVLNMTAAVIGQGPNGLLVTQMLRMLGCQKIIAVDRLQYRLEASKRMGAHGVICSEQASDGEVVERLKEMNGGQLADIAVEVVGHHASALDLACSATKAFSSVLIFGLPPHESHSSFTIRWQDYSRNLRYITTHAPDMDCFRLGMLLLSEGRLNIMPLFSHTFRFDSFGEAFETSSGYKADVLKSLIVFPDFEKHLEMKADEVAKM
ncbi:Sorbitol dehydrogenase 1 [Diplonema papillatum]|nr:Sorbitol dehydrogenase 1 [Diplonema papillatum]|eukprot:gene2301-3559_t